MADDSAPPEAALPFVAPCRTLAAGAPLGWLRAGWRDMWSAPRQSLTYGTIVVLASLALAWIAVEFGGYWQLLSLVSGFILVSPVLAVGTYAISSQLERGEKPSLRRCLREEQRVFGNLMVFALMLMVVFLVWARAGSAIHVFFPVGEQPGLARVPDVLRHRQRGRFDLRPDRVRGGGVLAADDGGPARGHGHGSGDEH